MIPNPPDLPQDYDQPKWNHYNRVHNWRNHITPEIQRIWDTFNDEQKRAIACMAQCNADCEEWE